MLSACTLPLSCSRLVGVAGLAIDRRDLVGMRIALDVGVAVAALQAAVNAGAELLAVDGDAVAGAVGHGGVAVAGEAIGLRAEGGMGASAKARTAMAAAMSSADERSDRA